MSGSRDLHKALASLWSSSGLDTKLKAYWAAADRSRYMSLNDAQATPGTPFPYAVFSLEKSDVKSRMSGEGANGQQHINHIPLKFEVYAEQVGTVSAKTQASMVEEEIRKVFGGHPTQAPSSMTLDSGSVLIVQFQGDFGERVGDLEHKWTIDYNVVTDVPVMV